MDCCLAMYYLYLGAWMIGIEVGLRVLRLLNVRYLPNGNVTVVNDLLGRGVVSRGRLLLCRGG